jgi:uncharacterized protein
LGAGRQDPVRRGSPSRQGRDLPRAGAPAPTGVSEETLRRLGELIETIEPQHVAALGDFTHARAAMTPGLLNSLCAWRTRWSSLAFTIVLGNHDRGAGPFHSDCGFACADAPALIGGIECRHRPIARDNVSGPLALAGHLHPVVRLNGPGRDSLRTPCFVMGERQIVLPAWRVCRRLAGDSRRRRAGADRDGSGCV